MATSKSLNPVQGGAKLQLRLGHFFALIAVTATVLAFSVQVHALLGLLMGLHALALVCLWRWPRTVLAAVPLLLLAYYMLLMPAACRPHVSSAHHARIIAVALQSYYDDHGHFPPAVVTAPDGTPLYSWRVLVLPYLEQSNLYEAFHLDEPWDSPHNLQLAAMIPREFSSPQTKRKSMTTEFVAVTGEETLWPSTAKVTYADVPDGITATLAIVEWQGSDIVWTEPRDLPMQKVSRWWRGSARKQRNNGRVAVAWADGHTALIDPATLSAPVLRGLLTRSGQDQQTTRVD